MDDRNTDNVPHAGDGRPLVRVFVADARLELGAETPLPKPVAHYLGTVMRLSAGDAFEIFNGRDGAWRAQFQPVSKAAAVAQIEGCVAPQETPNDIWIIAAPLKKGRIDWLAEKVCELGAARLLPIITARTIVDRVNTERLFAHMVEAAEQCGRTHVPEIADVQKLLALLKAWPRERILLFCDEAGGADFRAAVAPLAGKPLAILIGPEGGFTAEERAAIRAVPRVLALSLGPRILRADTAAVAALTAVQVLTGGWSR